MSKFSVNVLEVKKLFITSFFIFLITCNSIVAQNIFIKSVKAKEGHKMNKNSVELSTVPLENISLTIVYDNNAYKKGLSTAWGFSCLIKGTEKTILFDTGGNSMLLLANMNKLGIDPKEIDLVVISHIHGDHVGGLKGFLEHNKNVSVFFPASFSARFRNDLAKSGALARVIHDAAMICNSVYSTGELGMWIKEQALIIHTDKGIILITGCAHPGILKVVKTAKNLIGDDVLLAMGGFHLSGASRSVIEGIISKIKKSGVRYAGPCHCSGDLARQLFKIEYGNNYIDVGVGRIIQFK
jgi:7,8-dihydropterin-6-yl-methyl-4-(beta-D-ribofuranosyl)aminobenzene 5'-phosphate synthase